jgi:hypothetical protein
MQGEWNCSIEMEYSSMLHHPELRISRSPSKQRPMSSCTCRPMIIDGFL